MQLLINMAVWSYVAWFSTCNLTDMEWDTFLPDMASLCPSVDVCGRTDPGVTNVSVEKNSCCVGCSCRANCHEHGNCCFDDNNGDLIEQPASCLKPSTNQELPDLDLPKYKFIANPPTNGCKIQADEIQKPFVTCSSDIAVAPWGNFFPVYSKSMNKFFKNEPCALCHGADTSDIEHWSSTIIYTSTSSGHFISTMTDFYETYTSSKVAVVFNPPLKQTMEMDKRCFTLIDRCSSRRHGIYYIPSVVQLNRSAFSNACTYGPKAIYLSDKDQAYKNVFCAICSGFATKRTDRLECTTDDSLRFEHPPVTSLVDTGFLQSMETKPKDKKHKVCFRPGNELNDSRCVQTFCPVLQNRLPNGECDYPAVDTTLNCLRVPLSLSTMHIIDTSDLLNMTVTRRLAVFEEMNPWPNVWQIVLVRLLATANRTEFRLLLALKAKRFDIRQLTKGIEKRLTKPWTIHLNEKVEFTQSIHIPPSRWEDDLELVYSVVMFNQRFCIFLSKLFYCQQIELRSSEYRLESKAVYPIHNDRVLYEGEYTLLEAGDGSKKVRVCLEDSGYMRVQSANDADHVFHGTSYIHVLVWVILVCVLV